MAISSAVAVGDASRQSSLQRLRPMIFGVAQHRRRARTTGVEMGPLVYTRNISIASALYIDLGGARGRKGGRWSSTGRQHAATRDTPGLLSRAPSLFDHVRPDMEIYEREKRIFGPVLGIVRRARSGRRRGRSSNAHEFGNGTGRSSPATDSARARMRSRCGVGYGRRETCPFPVRPMAFHSFVRMEALAVR
jgi:acyl-CoA reductase-like NAD-dependent aldehyde dehydrogenase